MQADGDQRYDASDARRCNNNLDHDYDDCQHCGHPHGLEVEIVQGKDRTIFYLHPWCEAAYREKWGDKIINRDKPVADPTPSLAFAVTMLERPPARTSGASTRATPRVVLGDTDDAKLARKRELRRLPRPGDAHASASALSCTRSAPGPGCRSPFRIGLKFPFPRVI